MKVYILTYNDLGYEPNIRSIFGVYSSYEKAEIDMNDSLLSQLRNDYSEDELCELLDPDIEEHEVE